MYLQLFTIASVITLFGAAAQNVPLDAAHNKTCEKLEQCNKNNRTVLDDMVAGILHQLNDISVYDNICNKSMDAFSSCMKKIKKSLCPKSVVISWFDKRTRFKKFLCSKEARPHVKKLPGSKCMSADSPVNNVITDIMLCQGKMNKTLDNCQIKGNLKECYRKAYYDHCGPDYGFLGSSAFILINKESLDIYGPDCQ